MYKIDSKNIKKICIEYLLNQCCVDECYDVIVDSLMLLVLMLLLILLVMCDVIVIGDAADATARH